MSDFPAGHHLRSYEIDIPARFIRQAMEHIEHTQVRYVTFIFAGEATEDAVCAGVSTRHWSASPKSMREPVAATTREPVAATTREPAKLKRLTLKRLTNATVLEVLRDKQPWSTAEVSDELGIPTSEVALRQKVWRLMNKLHKEHILDRSGPTKRSQRFSLAAGESNDKMPVKDKMPVRTPRAQKQITEDMVLQQVRAGHTTSKDISDALGLRPKDRLRGTVTTHIRHLVGKHQIDKTGAVRRGGPVYKLVDEAGAMAG